MTEENKGKNGRCTKSAPNSGSVLVPPKTQQRLGYLDDPETLDELLDGFQSDGMPMGSKNWATHCLYRLKELKAKERMLMKLTQRLKEAEEERQLEATRAELWLDHRRCLTKKIQGEQNDQDETRGGKLN